MRQLQKQCTRLQEAVEWLWGDTKDTQVSTRWVAGGTWQLVVDHPAMSMVLLEQTLGVVSKQRHAGMVAGLGMHKGLLSPCPPQKADKAALKTKASQEELQHAMVQLSEMMQDLLQKMSQMDQDTQNALETLLNEMDSKVEVSPRGW